MKQAKKIVVMEQIPLDGLVGLAVAVKASGYHDSHIRKLLSQGKIEGRKVGQRATLVNLQSLMTYRSTTRKGNPQWAASPEAARADRDKGTGGGRKARTA